MTRLVLLDADNFTDYIDACVEVYVVAMGKPRDLVPARRAITRRHLEYDELRAVVALSDKGGLTGFTYGYHGQPGQWWHDSVTAELPETERKRWLADALELAELHVLPAWQGQGIGRSLVETLCAAVDRSTVVLSAIDGETSARRLYRALGFQDVLTDFAFPGSDERYAVMGRPLPLDAPGAP